MPDNTKVTITASVKAGDIGGNKIVFEVENEGTERLEDLMLRITIPFGDRTGDKVCLMKDAEDELVIESLSLTGSRNPLHGGSAVEWKTSSAGFDLDPHCKETITLTTFLAREEGTAPIRLGIIDESGSEQEWS